MTLYTVRPDFTVIVDSGIYLGGAQVELSDVEFAANSHKLENTDSKLVDFGSNDSVLPAPYVSKMPTKLFADVGSVRLKIEGSFFTPDLSVGVDSATVNDVEFISSNEIIVDLTAPSSPKTSSLTLNNGTELLIENALEFLSFDGKVIDLRLGASYLGSSAIEMREGMSFTQTADGLIFTGGFAWSGFARLVGDNDEWVWNRNEKKSLSLIFRTTETNSLFGIGSRANDPNAFVQYHEAEILAQISGVSIFSGLYGNGGTPGVETHQNSLFTHFDPSSTKKITFSSNGEPGGKFSLYELASDDTNDWLGGELLLEYTITASFAADEPEIMPLVIPYNGSSSPLLGLIIL